MPFTVSHAAAVLPLQSFRNFHLPLAALMVGSLSPDFSYFVPDPYADIQSHTLRGVFTFCLPTSLLVWLFFVSVLERPTLAFLPDDWRRRIAPSARLSPRSLLLAAVAAIIGAFTHLIWDTFTHASTPVTNIFTPLRAPLFEAGGLTVRVYFALQVLSSVFGLAVLGIWARNIRKRPLLPDSHVVPAQFPQVSNFERWLAVMMIGAISCAVALLNLARFENLRIDGTFFVLLIGGMTGAALGWTAMAVALRLGARDRTSRARPAARFPR